MDEKGYTFTPLAFLLFIPVMIVAASYGDIVEEINKVSTIAMGGDVTYTVATNIFDAIKEGAVDSGRNAAYNATRKVIDNRAFMGDSRTYIRQNILNSLNDHIIKTGKKLENGTGRKIYINNISITNSTYQAFRIEDISITQEDPFGYYVIIREGIPIKVVQNEQAYEGHTPEIKVYVSLEGMEDPYIWINSKNRKSNVIYKYPYYTYTALFGHEYHFDDSVDGDKLQHLWDCLNGTDNPSQIAPRPYYFPDPYGLSFFDRLENKTNASSTSNSRSRMSTFIIGDPLQEDHGGNHISCLDHEYFQLSPLIQGTSITIGNGNNPPEMRDPDSSIFYLSSNYKGILHLADNYH